MSTKCFIYLYMRWYVLLSVNITFGFKTIRWLLQDKIDLFQVFPYYLKSYLNGRQISGL